VAIFKRENFLNIGKNRTSLAVKIAEKKGRWLTYFCFFFAIIMEKQTTKPALRYRYAWGK
jgi:hypothetical protein